LRTLLSVVVSGAREVKTEVDLLEPCLCPASRPGLPSRARTLASLSESDLHLVHLPTDMLCLRVSQPLKLNLTNYIFMKIKTFEGGYIEKIMIEEDL
jgi:hypothetical protein